MAGSQNTKAREWQQRCHTGIHTCFPKACAASDLKGTASIDCIDQRVTVNIFTRCTHRYLVLAAFNHPHWSPFLNWAWLSMWRMTHRGCLDASAKLLAVEQNFHHPKYLTKSQDASGHSDGLYLSLNFWNLLAVYLPATYQLESYKILTKYMQVIFYISSPPLLVEI